MTKLPIEKNYSLQAIKHITRDKLEKYRKKYKESFNDLIENLLEKIEGEEEERDTNKDFDDKTVPYTHLGKECEPTKPEKSVNPIGIVHSDEEKFSDYPWNNV